MTPADYEDEYLTAEFNDTHITHAEIDVCKALMKAVNASHANIKIGKRTIARFKRKT